MSALEFSRPVEAARLGGAEVTYDIAANEAECAALARRFGLVSLNRFAAHVTLGRVPGGLVRLNAALSADLVQTDVVTLDPVPFHVEDEFTLLFGDTADDAASLDPDAELIEKLDDGRIDIGEAVAQQLSLAIDPYPRAASV